MRAQWWPAQSAHDTTIGAMILSILEHTPVWVWAVFCVAGQMVGVRGASWSPATRRFQVPGSRDTSLAKPRGPSLARALRSVGFGIVIGLCIAILRQQNVGYTLIYST